MDQICTAEEGNKHVCRECGQRFNSKELDDICHWCEQNLTIAALRRRVEELEGKAKMVDDLDYLRENEGAFVEIHCDNPEFDNSYDDCSIMIADDWTNDGELIIGGNSLADCLAKAAQMKRERTQPTPTRKGE